MENAEGTHLLVVDADEFYSGNDLVKLCKEVESSPEDIIAWEFERDNLRDKIYGGIVHFWHSIKYRAVGGYYSIPHQRIFKLLPGMKYIDSHNFPSDENRIRFDCMRNKWSKVSVRCYHAGFVKDFANTRDKQDYYYNRGEKVTKPMYSDTRELWFNWDGRTMEFPNVNVKILEYKGYIPDALLECVQ